MQHWFQHQVWMSSVIELLLRVGAISSVVMGSP